MSMHNAVVEVFNSKLSSEYPNISLTNSDVNRIVTSVVQTFSTDKTAEEMLKEQTENYIVRYKQRAIKKDCGCNKK